MQLDKEKKQLEKKEVREKYEDIQLFEVKNSPKHYREGRGTQHSHMRENLVIKWLSKAAAFVELRIKCSIMLSNVLLHSYQ